MVYPTIYHVFYWGENVRWARHGSKNDLGVLSVLQGSPSILPLQCLLSLLSLGFISVFFVLSHDSPSENTLFLLSERFLTFPDHLPRVIQYSRSNLIEQQLIYIFIFFFLWLKKEGNSWVSHICQLSFVAKWLMRLCPSNFSRTECQKNPDCFENPLKKYPCYYNLCLTWFSFNSWPLLSSPGNRVLGISYGAYCDSVWKAGGGVSTLNLPLSLQ